MFNIGQLEINYLDKRTPWNAAMWSALMPGLGQVLIHRIPGALFILIASIVIALQAKLLPAIHYTLLGQLDYAKSIINPQWFLNIPSIYFFAIYDAYVNTISNNKLFEWEQNKFLKKNYQNITFNMPFNKSDGSGERMYVVSTFDHSNYLELAITAIQMKGIPKEKILGVGMDKRGEELQLFDSIHSSDGFSLLDLPIIDLLSQGLGLSEVRGRRPEVRKSSEHDDYPNTKSEKTTSSTEIVFCLLPGDDLFSQGLAPQVSSALEVESRMRLSPHCDS